MPIYTAKNTSALSMPAAVFIDGKEVPRAFYADTEEGVVRSYAFPLIPDDASPLGLKVHEFKGKVSVKYIDTTQLSSLPSAQDTFSSAIPIPTSPSVLFTLRELARTTTSKELSALFTEAADLIEIGMSADIFEMYALRKVMQLEEQVAHLLKDNSNLAYQLLACEKHK